MATINIDGKDYEIENLSPGAKAQLGSVQFVDAEIARVQALLAALQTARNTYAIALNDELAKMNGPGETLRFNA